MDRALKRTVLGALVWALCIGLAGCGQQTSGASLNEEVARLGRDTQALSEAVAEARKGTLIRPDNVLISVHENAVRKLLGAALPREKTFGGVRIRVERVDVRFDGGFGTVNVYGWARLEKHPKVAADLYVSGGFSEMRIDPDRHVLTASLSLDTLDARPLPGGLLAWLFRGRLLRALNAFGRDQITRLLPPVELPLNLKQGVRISEVGVAAVRIQGGSLEVGVKFTRMFATEGRLWVELQPNIGEWRRTAGPK